MKKIIKIDDKIINIYYKDSLNKELPVIILNTYDENIDEIWNISYELNSKDYILVGISGINWNRDMSPWYMDKLYKNESNYDGLADNYLDLLINKIIPNIESFINNLGYKIQEYILGGYSLAGLFSIYSLYKTNKFNKIISCSGSLWYPNFIDFINNNKLLIKPSKIYLSLGNRENHSKNKLIKEVYNNTLYVEKFFKDLNINILFEENIGNHFQDISLRIAKGINWILR